MTVYAAGPRTRSTIATRVSVLMLAALAAVGLTIGATPVASAASAYDTAWNQFVNDNAGAAENTLNGLVAAQPRNADALALRAVVADYNLDLVTKADSLNRLSAIDGGLRSGVDVMLGAVTSSALSIPNPLPGLVGPQTAIVILGYGLLPNGAMRDDLIGRLSTGYLQALAAPGSPVIVTGGNPQNGITEAAAMKSWLVGRGLPASRVHAETRAGSTVGNALYSTSLMRTLGATSSLIVTDPNHIRRAMVDFVTAGAHPVGGMATLNDWVEQIPPLLDKHDQLGMYLDGARTLGL